MQFYDFQHLLTKVNRGLLELVNFFVYKIHGFIASEHFFLHKVHSATFIRTAL